MIFFFKFILPDVFMIRYVFYFIVRISVNYKIEDFQLMSSKENSWTFKNNEI